MQRHMKLTKKDADIVALKNFLPEDLVQQICEKFGERKFTTTVKALSRQCIHQNLKEPTKIWSCRMVRRSIGACIRTVCGRCGR